MSNVLDALSKPIKVPKQGSIFSKITEPLSELFQKSRIAEVPGKTLQGLGVIGDAIDLAVGTPGKAAALALGDKTTPFKFTGQASQAVERITGNKFAGEAAGFAAGLIEPFGLPGKGAKVFKTGAELISALSKEKNAANIAKLLEQSAKGLSPDARKAITPRLARATDEAEVRSLLDEAAQYKPKTTAKSSPVMKALESSVSKGDTNAIGPGAQIFHAKLDRLVRNRTLDKEDANLLKHIFADTKDDFLGKVNVRDSARLKVRGGIAHYNRSGTVSNLTLKKGLATLAEENGGKFWNSPETQPSKIFLHEYGHLAHALVLDSADQKIVTEVFREMGAGKRLKTFADGLSNTAEGSTGGAYYAKDEKEFLAQSFAEYVLQNKVPAEKMRPLLERLFSRFAEGLKRLVNRANPTELKRLEPIFEKMLSGDSASPLSRWIDTQPISFRRDLIDLLEKGISPASKTAGKVESVARTPISEVVPKLTTVEPPFKTPVNPEPGTVDSAVAKLAQAIRDAKPISQDIGVEQTAERARRIEAIRNAGYGKGGGEDAYGMALSKLKGQLTDKKSFDPVRDVLTQDEIDSLFTKIETHQQFDSFEKIAMQDGLSRLLRGEIPQPKQLEHLEEVFGSKIIQAIQSKASFWSKAGVAITDIINLPRSLMTSFDMSAPLRQGLLLTQRNPIRATKSFNQMFRQAFSEKNFDQWLDDLYASPDWPDMRRSGLYVADPRRLAGGLSTREEGFISRIAERFPGVKASQRSYLAYLNKLRVDNFREMANTFKAQGAGDEKSLEALAAFVNTATGRGDLGYFGRISPVLDSLFFSPRLIAARISMLNPAWYAKQPKAVRMEAMKTMAQFVATGLSVLTLAKLGGADVEADPRSTDFGKIKVGDTRWDIWGGFQQWARMFAQVTTGEKKNAKGKIEKLGEKYGSDTRLDVLGNFAISKFAPIPGLAAELLKGKQFNGEDLTLGDALLSNTLPLYAQDLADVYKEGGLGKVGAAAVPAFFGVGVSSYGNTSRASEILNSKKPSSGGSRVMDALNQIK